MGEKKGQTSFKKSSGKGSVTLKLVESAEPYQQLRAYAIVGKDARGKEMDGSGSMHYLGDDWDFSSAVDSQTSTFAVSIDASLINGAAIQIS